MLAAKEFPDKGKHRIFRYRGEKRKERKKGGRDGGREEQRKEGEIKENRNKVKRKSWDSIGNT